jgi:hypothetical protein
MGLTAHFETSYRVNLCFSPEWQTTYAIKLSIRNHDAPKLHGQQYRQCFVKQFEELLCSLHVSQKGSGATCNLQYPWSAPQEKSLVLQGSLSKLGWLVIRQRVRLSPGPTVPTFSAWNSSKEKHIWNFESTTYVPSKCSSSCTREYRGSKSSQIVGNVPHALVKREISMQHKMTSMLEHPPNMFLVLLRRTRRLKS